MEESVIFRSLKYANDNERSSSNIRRTIQIPFGIIWICLFPNSKQNGKIIFDMFHRLKDAVSGTEINIK